MTKIHLNNTQKITKLVIVVSFFMVRYKECGDNVAAFFFCYRIFRKAALAL
jgi:hypothetical protein